MKKIGFKLRSKQKRLNIILWAAVSAVNWFLNPDYYLVLNEYSWSMHEWVRRVAERFDDVILPIYESLDLDNWIEQMWISEVECCIIDSSTWDKKDLISMWHDDHGNIANIKALLYCCIPYIYKKIKSLW